MSARKATEILSLNFHHAKSQYLAQRPAPPPPDPRQTLPNNEYLALLASATCRYNELAIGLNNIAGKDLLPDAQFIAFNQYIANNPLMAKREEMPIDEVLLRHQLRNFPIFTLGNLPLSVVIARQHDFVLRFFRLKLSKEAKELDIRHLTPKHLSPCINMKNQGELELLQNMIAVIAVTGACLDRLRVPHPDRMEIFPRNPAQARNDQQGRSRFAVYWNLFAASCSLRLQ